MAQVANRYITATKILNDTAVEVGINPIADPWNSTDPLFVQMKYLLNNAGQELLELYEWPVLRASHTIVTDSGSYPDQIYPLPDDYAYMIDQTGWDRDANLPLQGPMTPQQWTYLEGRDLASGTIYASFRLANGDIMLYPPEGIADGRTITFEYIMRTWGLTGSFPTQDPVDELQTGEDVILYEPILIKRYLKMKFQAAKGFDTSVAVQEFTQAMDTWTGRSKGGKVLNASGARRGFPFLNVWRNSPDTGYGL